MDLVLGARARRHQLRAPRQPAAHHADRLIRHPDRIQRPGRQQLCQRQRVEAVGLRARLTDAGVARVDHHHPGDVRLDDPRDLPRVARDLQGHLVIRRQALREQLKVLRRGRDAPRARGPRTSPRSRPRRNRDGRPTRSTSPRPPSHRLMIGRTVGKRHTTDSRSQRNRASRRGGQRKARAQGPSSKEPACPTCVLPEGPCPSRATVATDPDAASEQQFHAPTSGSHTRP